MTNFNGYLTVLIIKFQLDLIWQKRSALPAKTDVCLKRFPSATARKMLRVFYVSERILPPLRAEQHSYMNWNIKLERVACDGKVNSYRSTIHLLRSQLETYLEKNAKHFSIMPKRKNTKLTCS